MSISYNKLWKLLIALNMSKTQLCKISGVGGKNKLVAKESFLKIMSTLNVDVSEIISSYVINVKDVK